MAEHATIADDLVSLAVDIDTVRQLPGNPRRGDVDAVAASLTRFGQRKPIVVSEDGVIVAGNHTWEAAKRLGWPQIAVVRVADDDATAKAFALADNRTAELGGYDEAALLDLIRQVEQFDADLLADTGWGSDAIDDLVERVIDSMPPEPPDDDAPPTPPKVPVSTAGDVWLLGDHRVLCGDATEPGDYATLLGGEPAALIVTDPPYGVDYVGKTEESLTIANDSRDIPALKRLLDAAFEQMHTHAAPGAGIYVFHSDSGGDTFRRSFIDAGWQLKQVLVWVKNTIVLGRQDYHWRHEPILYGWRTGGPHKWYGDRTGSTVLETGIAGFARLNKPQLLELLTDLYRTSTVQLAAKPAASRLHPTMKPIELLQVLIGNSSRRAGIVMDPFGGSGSTLMACEYMGRRARVLELDPIYVDVICRRWQEYTGSKPVLESTGKPHDFTEGD